MDQICQIDAITQIPSEDLRDATGRDVDLDAVQPTTGT
jgi:hypothetical protein